MEVQIVQDRSWPPGGRAPLWGVRSAVLCLFSLAALSGCGDTVGMRLDPAGTYQLTEVDGLPLPFALQSSAEIISGSATLRPDRSYSTQTDIREQDAVTGEITIRTEIDHGQYTHNGGSMTFTPGGSPAASATYDGIMIVVASTPRTRTYRR